MLRIWLALWLEYPARCLYDDDFSGSLNPGEPGQLQEMDFM
jgi:hypothetical protein